MPLPIRTRFYERAREVWASQRYPAVVAYAVDVAAGSNGKIDHRHYHEYWTARDNRVVVKPPISDEQIAHPYKPSAGVNFDGWNIGGPRVGTGDRDFIGVPLLSPNYSFGVSTYVPPQDLTPSQLVEEIRREYHDPSPKKISDLEQRSGLNAKGPAYHLTLSPVRDPLNYRLRDLWIDTKSAA